MTRPTQRPTPAEAFGVRAFELSVKAVGEPAARLRNLVRVTPPKGTPSAGARKPRSVGTGRAR